MSNSPLKSTFESLDIQRLAKIATSNLPAANAGNEGSIVYDDTANTFKYSNGTTWVEPSGGGSTLWTQAQSTSGVNATVYATSFTATGVTDSDAVIQPLGAGSLLAQIPDGTTVGGNKRGGGATDFQRYRSGSAQVASGLYSFIGAGQNNTASGDYDIIVGGDTNTTSSGGVGARNTVVGGQYNVIIASYGGGGVNNFIGGGYFNQMTQAPRSSCIVGGESNTIGDATPTMCIIGTGYQNYIQLVNYDAIGYCSILNGNNNLITGKYSTILGGAWGTDRGVNGKTVIAVGDATVSGPNGIHQTGVQITRAVTTSAVAKPLTTDNAGALDGVNANVIPSNVAYKVRAEVVALDQTTGDIKAWTLECLAANSLFGTGIIGTPPSAVIVGDSGVSWTASLVWDSGTNSIYVEAVGDSSNSVSWTSTMYTTEVSY